MTVSVSSNSALMPAFTLCVQMAGSVLNPASTGRLPTAATCFNMLKLPPYNTLQEMKGKLLMAVMGTTTFDLS